MVGKRPLLNRSGVRTEEREGQRQMHEVRPKGEAQESWRKLPLAACIYMYPNDRSRLVEKGRR
jgi:hypothetical protein